MGDRRLAEHIGPFIAARSYRPASARQRRQVLGQFAAVTGNPQAKNLTVGMVLEWWQGTERMRPAARRNYLSAVRTFCTHLRTLRAIPADPTEAIKRPQVHRADPVTLTPAEVVRLLAEITNTRDRAMVSLMLGCALRSFDVSRLQVQDVDLRARILSVEGKGGKVRAVPIPTATVECVGDYLAERPAVWGPLIRKHWCQEGLAAPTVQMHVTKLLRDAGVKKGPWDGRSSHVLRRTCASVLLESGASVRDVQVILGHSSLASTEHYLRRPDRARLQRVMESGPLREEAPGPGGPGAVTGRGTGRIMSSLDAS